MAKIYLSVRNEKGHIKTVDPANLPEWVTPEIKAAAEALLASMQPKRGRGRPAGYKCSQDTIERMVAGRLATLARKRQEAQSDSGAHVGEA